MRTKPNTSMTNVTLASIGVKLGSIDNVKASESKSGPDSGVVIGLIALVVFIACASALFAVILKRRRKRPADDWGIVIVNQGVNEKQPDLRLLDVSYKSLEGSIIDESKSYCQSSQSDSMDAGYMTFSSEGSLESSGGRYPSKIVF